MCLTKTSLCIFASVIGVIMVASPSAVSFFFSLLLFPLPCDQDMYLIAALHLLDSFRFRLIKFCAKSNIDRDRFPYFFVPPNPEWSFMSSNNLSYQFSPVLTIILVYTFMFLFSLIMNQGLKFDFSFILEK